MRHVGEANKGVDGALNGKKMLMADGCGRRIASGFGVISSTGRALGVAWRDII